MERATEYLSENEEEASLGADTKEAPPCAKVSFEEAEEESGRAASAASMVPDIASVCRLHHSESFSPGDRDVLALYEVQPRDLDDLALFKDEPLYKVHRPSQAGSVGSQPVGGSLVGEVGESGTGYGGRINTEPREDSGWTGEKQESEGGSRRRDSRAKGLRRAVSDDVIRTYYVGAATRAEDILSNSCDEHLSGKLPIVQGGCRSRRRKKRTKSIDHYPFVLGHESEAWTFTDSLIWTICEFLPQEEVFYNLVYVAKSWRHALRNFPLILDQGAVKSFLGMRAIRMPIHAEILARILKQWSIGFLCLRLKSRDTLEDLVTKFPSLRVSLWGLVLKTKKTTRWTSESEVNALASLKNLQVLGKCKVLSWRSSSRLNGWSDIRCCEGLESLSQVLR